MFHRFKLLKSIFLPVFFVLFALSFFLIETEYRYLLYLAWAIFLLIYTWIYRIKFQLTPDVICLSIFMLALIISLLFSQQIYLSLEKILAYLVLYGLYLLFRFLPQSWRQESKLMDFILLLVLVLNLLVIVLSFFPQLQTDLTSMNLILQNYGHNHYAAFLLLVLPVLWWQLISNHSRYHYLNIAVLLSSYLIVFLSLARIALLLVFLQFLLLLFLPQQQLAQVQQHWLKIITKILLFSFTLTLSVYLLLTTPLSTTDNQLCLLSLGKKQLCQPIGQNARLNYWTNAWEIFRHHPWTGSGLGSFYLASHSLIFDQGSQSIFAHNIFLHLLAETGLLAPGALLIFLGLFIGRWPVVNSSNKNQSLIKFLFVGVVFSWLNALIDFDFQFFVIVLLTWTFMALIWRDSTQAQKKLQLPLLPLVGVSLIISIIGSGNYLLVKHRLKQQRLDQALQLLPVPSLQSQILNDQYQLTAANYRRLLEVYPNDYRLLLAINKQDHLPNDLAEQAYQQLLSTDLPAALALLDFNQTQVSSAQLMAQFLLQRQQQGLVFQDSYFGGYQRRQVLAQQAFDLAQQAYLEQNWSAAVDLYHLALLLNPYVMANQTLVFVEDGNLNNLAQFLPLANFDPQLTHEHFVAYMQTYETLLINRFVEGDIDHFILWTEQILAYESNFAVFLFRDLISYINQASATDRLRLLANFQLTYQHFTNLPAWAELAAEQGLDNFDQFFVQLAD